MYSVFLKICWPQSHSICAQVLRLLLCSLIKLPYTFINYVYGKGKGMGAEINVAIQQPIDIITDFLIVPCNVQPSLITRTIPVCVCVPSKRN